MEDNEDRDRIYSPLPERHVQRVEKELVRGRQADRLLATQENGHVVEPYEGRSGLQAQKSPQRVCGMSLLAFTLTAITTTAVVVGAAIGGGLGSLVVRQRHEPTSSTPTKTTITATTTVTTSSAAQTTTGGLLVNYQVAAPYTVASVPLDCSNIDDQPKYAQSWKTHAFVISCTAGLYGGDIGSIVAYTIEDCIDACGSLNAWQSNDTACVGVQFIIGIASSVSGGSYGNCFMKNSSTEVIPPGGGMSASASQAPK